MPLKQKETSHAENRSDHRRFSFEEWGGTENTIWNSVLGMRRHNVESEILSTTALAPTEFEERNGVTIARFPYFYPYCR